MKNKALFYLTNYESDILTDTCGPAHIDQTAERAIGAAWAFSDIGVITWDEAKEWAERFNKAWASRRPEVFA